MTDCHTWCFWCFCDMLMWKLVQPTYHCTFMPWSIEASSRWRLKNLDFKLCSTCQGQVSHYLNLPRAPISNQYWCISLGFDSTAVLCIYSSGGDAVTFVLPKTSCWERRSLLGSWFGWSLQQSDPDPERRASDRKALTGAGAGALTGADGAWHWLLLPQVSLWWKPVCRPLTQPHIPANQGKGLNWSSGQ